MSVFLSLISVALVASPGAFAAADNNQPAITNITTSSAVHDCFLLFKGAESKWEGFNPFYDCIPQTRRRDWFSYIAARPYQEDLYTYWYFDDANKYNYQFDTKAKYAVNLFVAKGAESSEVVWDNGLKTYDLEPVGEPYHVGTQWLLKFAVRSVFPGIKQGEKFGFCITRFGALSADGVMDMGRSYDLEEKQLFSYEDSQFDITSKIWGDKTSVVSVTKSDAFPLVVQKEPGRAASFCLAEEQQAKIDKKKSNWELHGLYFDLDRNPDFIKHIDIEYQMVEYYVSADHDSWSYGPAFETGGSTTWTHLAWRVPDSPRYVPGNETEKKYAGTKYATKITPRHADVYAKDAFDITETQRNMFGGWFGIPEEITHTTHVQKIIDIGVTKVEDDNLRNWIDKNCVKPNGEKYRYAVFYELTTEEWTEQEDGREEEYLLFFKTGIRNKRLARCHTSQGVYITKMTVMEALDELHWNAFMQPVNAKPGVLLSSHSFTLREMMISWGGAARRWMGDIAMPVYAIVCAAAIGFITLAIIRCGRKRNNANANGIKMKK